jgi:hypothetical protein
MCLVMTPAEAMLAALRPGGAFFRRFAPPARQKSDQIRDIGGGQRRLAVMREVRHSEVRPTGDHDAPQSLVADEIQEGRVVDGEGGLTVFRGGLPVVAVTGSARRQEPVAAGVGVAAGLGRKVGRRTFRRRIERPPRRGLTIGNADNYHSAGNSIRLIVSHSVGNSFHLVYQHGHLCGRQRAAVFAGKSGHQRPWPPRGDDLLHCLHRHDGPEQRVV